MSSQPSATHDQELPGMLAVAKGVAEQRWPHTMDAAVWAAEYVKLNPGADEGLMLSWFANAIMAGYDTANARRSETVTTGDALRTEALNAINKLETLGRTMSGPHFTDRYQDGPQCLDIARRLREALK